MDDQQKRADLVYRNFQIGYKSMVAMVREKYLENEIFSRSGKSMGILWMVREI